MMGFLSAANVLCVIQRVQCVQVLVRPDLNYFLGSFFFFLFFFFFSFLSFLFFSCFVIEQKHPTETHHFWWCFMNVLIIFSSFRGPLSSPPVAHLWLWTQSLERHWIRSKSSSAGSPPTDPAAVCLSDRVMNWGELASTRLFFTTGLFRTPERL